MKDYLKVTLYATLIVILVCLARSGHGQRNAFMDYSKRVPSATIRRSKTIDMDDIENFMKGVARGRGYFVDPSYYQQHKRQQASTSGLFSSSLGLLMQAHDTMLRRLASQKQQAINREMMDEGGKR